MLNMRSVLVLSCAAAALSGVGACGTPRGKVHYDSVERTIIPGETTQNQIIELMGSPSLVTRNSRGEQVWTYSRKTYNPETGKVAGGVILSGGTQPSSSGKNTALFDLILTFDKAELVRDYNVVSTDF